jgi:hypothetical protein
MADYFPLISQAVAGLVHNDLENRQALYGRAHVALVEQLREITPALSEMQIVREQADLEIAIRKVEAQRATAPTVKIEITPIAPLQSCSRKRRIEWPPPLP